jgi:hypothetical protein
MSSVTKIPNSTALVLDKKGIAGVDKYFASVSSLTLAGTSLTPAALKAVFQSDIDATASVDALRAQYKQQVVNARAARKAMRDVRRKLKAFLLGNYGAEAVAMLEDFGIPVPKALGLKTVQSKAKAVANAKATRKARNTMGKKQRQTIKGAPAAPAENGTPPKS